MNEEAEHFRKVTMAVLSMQLNSIIVMDIVALGGAAAGITVAVAACMRGRSFAPGSSVPPSGSARPSSRKILSAAAMPFIATWK